VLGRTPTIVLTYPHRNFLNEVTRSNSCCDCEVQSQFLAVGILDDPNRSLVQRGWLFSCNGCHKCAVRRDPMCAKALSRH